MTTTDKKAEPFRITGPGRYRMYNNEIVHIKHGYSGNWFDQEECRGGHGWRDDGTSFRNSWGQLDNIVARLDEPAEEMAGLRGYAIVTERKNGAFNVEGHGHPVMAQELADNFRGREDAASAFVIDLSKVPASAIVRPEPKVETRKIWLVLWKDGVITAHSAKPDVTGVSAIFEREIIFQIGEGLEAGK